MRISILASVLFFAQTALANLPQDQIVISNPEQTESSLATGANELPLEVSLSENDSYDFEIEILDPDQAIQFMQENEITDEELITAEMDFLSNDSLYASTKKPKAQKRNCVARNGEASWYGPGFHGKKVACPGMGRFNQNAMTAAHKTIKCGSKVKVTYKGRSVVVIINDAGPYHGGRVIDLSKAAAKKLKISTGKVQLQILRCGP